MPALTIPAQGFGEGTAPTFDTGIEQVISKGGTMRGWSDYDAVHREFTLSFPIVTMDELATMETEYLANRLTGGMTFTAPWNGDSYTFDYVSFQPTPKGGVLFSVIIRGRQQ